MTLRGLLRQLHWYVRELTGEADYERYCARHSPAPTRREYERIRARHQEGPPTRCC